MLHVFLSLIIYNRQIFNMQSIISVEWLAVDWMAKFWFPVVKLITFICTSTSRVSYGLSWRWICSRCVELIVLLHLVSQLKMLASCYFCVFMW